MQNLRTLEHTCQWSLFASFLLLSASLTVAACSTLSSFIAFRFSYTSGINFFRFTNAITPTVKNAKKIGSDGLTRNFAIFDSIRKSYAPLRWRHRFQSDLNIRECLLIPLLVLTTCRILKTSSIIFMHNEREPLPQIAQRTPVCHC